MNFNVRWSIEDEQFVATVEEYPSLSWLADTSEGALDGIREIAYITRDDIAANGA